jgi:hypothetical protein
MHTVATDAAAPTPGRQLEQDEQEYGGSGLHRT